MVNLDTELDGGQPKAIVAIPIYKESLNLEEFLPLKYSLEILSNHKCIFVVPTQLDVSRYEQSFPGIEYLVVDEYFLKSIDNYNHLLLAAEFYELFRGYTHLLILQTDAIVFRDELDYWAAQPYDYIGAPFKEGFRYYLNAYPFDGERAGIITSHVGNGGLSLRNVAACALLLRRYPEVVKHFHSKNGSEDLFFSLLGTVDPQFRLPDQYLAAKFSLEKDAEYYLERNRQELPFGAHAWTKYSPILASKIVERLNSWVSAYGTNKSNPQTTY